VRRRTRIALALGGALLLMLLAPILYIEIGCRSPLPGFEPAGYRPLLPAQDRRPEARTWLTYPEWHIVYSAESFGRHLAAGRPPSAYGYGSDIKGFWSAYCALNRATQGSSDAGAAKVMIYTIGISYTAELAVKALYEGTIGRLSEWIGGWRSADDRHAAKVQQSYGAFMHETPWYRFPFDAAFGQLWATDEPEHHLRHWERRFALSAEYGVKAGYAKLIDSASGAALGRDALMLRFVARGTADQVRAVDPRLKPVRALPGGLLIVEAPRYAQFSDLLAKLAKSPVELVEIAGNDDIFVTLAVPGSWRGPRDGVVLLSMPIGERPGGRREGLSVKVADLLPLIREVRATGGIVEHVYDY
jgi:hypothetical protein